MKPFGKLENELIELCHQYPPNLDAIKAKIAEGADVNAYDDDRTVKTSLLAEVIYNYGWNLSDKNSAEDYNCEYLPAIVTIILDAGFDVALDDGRYGAMALAHLRFCATDRRILEVAKLLLNAGADPHVAPYEDEPYGSAIEDIRFETQIYPDETVRNDLLWDLADLLECYPHQRRDL